MLSRFGFPQIAFNDDGEGGAGGGGDGGGTPAAPAADATAPENVLFPDEGKTGDPDPNAGKTESEGGAADWKEYVNDPSKSEAENAAAKAEHDKGKPAEKTEADTVPADGVYKLTMPEGVELDTEMATALGGEFKELGLTHAQAQKLTDKYIATMQAREAGKLKNWGERIQGWADTAKKDPDIGGAKWDQTVSDAQRAVNTLGTPALKEYLNASGGGNHPELIRVLAKAGALIKEDSPPAGGGEGRGKPADAAHVLFPNDVPKG